MKNRHKKRSTKAGLPPGSLVHLGEKTAAAARLTLLEYTAETLHESEVSGAQLADTLKTMPPETRLWLNLRGLGDTALLQQIGACFNLHPLVLEDILNTGQRAKLEDYGDYLYLVLRTFRYEKNGGDDIGAFGKSDTDRISSNQVSLVLGKNFVLTFLETDSPEFAVVRERLAGGKGQTRSRGVDYLTYSLIDCIVDSYFAILEKLDEKTENLELALSGKPRSDTLHAIYQLKREGVYLRKSLWPLREVISSLQRGETKLFERDTLLYLRDVYDHTIHIIESVESLRDLTAGMLDIYVSGVSYRINAVMKVLTIITTIFMPLSFIAGLYGMNFKYLPGLEWHWGFLAVLAVMAGISLGMLALFRWKKWL